MANLSEDLASEMFYGRFREVTDTERVQMVFYFYWTENQPNATQFKLDRRVLTTVSPLPCVYY